MEMNNEIFRELLAEKKKISSQLIEIEQKYKMKKYPDDFMAQMVSSFELEEIENDPEFGKEYKCLGEEYSSLLKKFQHMFELIDGRFRFGMKKNHSENEKQSSGTTLTRILHGQ